MLLDSNWVLCYQTHYLHQLFEISFYDQRPCFSFAFLSFKENFQYHYLHIISVSLRFSFRAKSSTEFTQQQMHTTFLCLTISIISTAMIWLISVIQFFFYFVNCFLGGLAFFIHKVLIFSSHDFYDSLNCIVCVFLCNHFA